MSDMANERYRASRLKLKRGIDHINHLRDYVANYTGAALVPEPENGGIAWRIRISEDPAYTVHALLGDAIHNLRAALDHAAVEAVRLNGKNPKGVYFPFAEDASQIEAMIVQRKFNRASDEAQDLVRKLKPYKGGNAPLRAIHDLDVADKHHSLISFTGIAKQTTDFTIGTNVISGSMIDLRDGAGLLFAPLQPFLAYNHRQVGFVAAFEKGQPLGGNEVVPTLTSLSKLVEGVVEAFAALP